LDLPWVLLTSFVREPGFPRTHTDQGSSLTPSSA
jgi:hypothetical protein